MNLAKQEGVGHEDRWHVKPAAADAAFVASADALDFALLYVVLKLRRKQSAIKPLQIEQLGAIGLRVGPHVLAGEADGFQCGSSANNIQRMAVDAKPLHLFLADDEKAVAASDYANVNIG